MLTLFELCFNVRIDQTAYIRFPQGDQLAFKQLQKLTPDEAERFSEYTVTEIVPSADGEIIIAIAP